MNAPLERTPQSHPVETIVALGLLVLLLAAAGVETAGTSAKRAAANCAAHRVCAPHTPA